MIFIDDDGSVLVGRVAESLAGGAPERVIRSPKRLLAYPAPIVIGGRSFDTTRLVADLLRYVLGEGERYLGRLPDEVRLTHPATWGRPQIARLVEAASQAGIVGPSLVPEPVAAALTYAYASGPPLPTGAHVAVYDLGGGTFDTALLRATAEGFTIVGRPTGDANLGGELFDDLIAEYLSERLPDSTHEALLVSDDPVWRRCAAGIRTEARRAKEALSLHPHTEVQLSTPLGNFASRLTNEELHGLVDPYLEESVDRLVRLIDDEGVPRNALAALYLTGGATRMPRVSELLHRTLAAVPIIRRGDPKAAVAIGATHEAIRSSFTSFATSGTVPPAASPGTTEPSGGVGDRVTQSPELTGPGGPQPMFPAVPPGATSPSGTFPPSSLGTSPVGAPGSPGTFPPSSLGTSPVGAPGSPGTFPVGGPGSPGTFPVGAPGSPGSPGTFPDGPPGSPTPQTVPGVAPVGPGPTDSDPGTDGQWAARAIGSTTPDPRGSLPTPPAALAGAVGTPAPPGPTGERPYAATEPAPQLPSVSDPGPRSRRSLVAILSALIVVLLGITGVAVFRAGRVQQFALGPGEVFLEPSASQGPDPFSTSTTQPTPNLSGDAGNQASGQSGQNDSPDTALAPGADPNSPNGEDPTASGPAANGAATVPGSASSNGPGSTPGTTASSNGPTPSGPVPSAPGSFALSSRGDTPGLYGGTRDQGACDVAKLVEFLSRTPDKAAAWSAVHGIAPDQLAAYVATLTPVVLLVDTRVTNHGFAKGKATPRQAVLQAGTAVLVDEFGVPRVRCACGNPLIEPTAVSGSTVRYVGTGWTGFAPKRLTRIVPATRKVSAFTLVDAGGKMFVRPSGTSGSADAAASGENPPASTATATTSTSATSTSTTTEPTNATPSTRAESLSPVETAPILEIASSSTLAPEASTSPATSPPTTETPTTETPTTETPTTKPEPVTTKAAEPTAPQTSRPSVGTTVPAAVAPTPVPLTRPTSAPRTTIAPPTLAATTEAPTQVATTVTVAPSTAAPPTAPPPTPAPTTVPPTPAPTTVPPTAAPRALPAIPASPVPALSGGTGTREFFTDTFADPLDYSNDEDVALVNEGPIQGNAAAPTLSGGQMTVTFESPGYFSPLWGGYDTGGRSDGSDAIGHDREGNAHPVDPSRYPTFRVRMNASGAAGAGIFFYTCKAGVNDGCQTGVQFVTEPGWKVYEAPLPQGRPVTGIRVAVSPDGAPITVVVDWAAVYGSGPGNTDGAGGVGGPVPELLNPDAAGAVPYLFPFGGRPVPYTARVCANNDWSALTGDAWDMDKKADVEKVDNYTSWSVGNGVFDGVTVGATSSGAAGDPGVRVALRKKTIDARIWHRNTLIVPSWDGRYSQQFGDDGGWVYRVLWKFVGNDRFQISLPAVEYPNDTTISIDLNDPTPFDGSPVPALNVNEPAQAGQIGWSTPAKKVATFRHDLAEPYKPKHTPIDQILLSTDDCAASDVDIVYRENNPGGATKYEFLRSASPVGPWESIGSVDANLSAPGIWTWANAPKGSWWIKVVATRNGATGEHVSTGPVLVGSGYESLKG